MEHSHYETFEKKDLILRDHLAIDRTILANENTLLAYVRTALAILISGISLIKFFTLAYLQLLGGILIFLGIITLIVGLYRFATMKKSLKNIR